LAFLPKNHFIHLIFFVNISTEIDMLRYFLILDCYQNSSLNLA
jgi:hypothetical protein